MSEDVRPSPVERIAASFKRLADSASELNKVSDEFGQPVAVIEQALRRLNLGVEAWERIRGSDGDSDGDYWSERVGFMRIGAEWCIVIRKIAGNHNWPDQEDVETWQFNVAPRSLRIEAIDQLPDLVEKLIASAEKTARKMREKQNNALSLAKAVTDVGKSLNPKKGTK